MESFDPLTAEEIRRFAEDVVYNMVRYGELRHKVAEDRFNESPIAKGLREIPDYYLHESPYYWAMYLLTGDRYVSQIPPESMVTRSRTESFVLSVERYFETATSAVNSSVADTTRGQLDIQLMWEQADLLVHGGFQLPESCSGHWEVQPRIAFLGPAAYLFPDDSPRVGTSMEAWLAYYQTRLDRRHRGKVIWWHEDGTIGGPIHTFNFYERILEKALGSGVKLGWDAMVVNAIPYKLPYESRLRTTEIIELHLPHAMRVMQAIGVTTIVALGKPLAEAMARLTSGSNVKEYGALVGTTHRARIEDFPFTWIPCAHPVARIPMNEERVVQALSRTVG